MSRTDWKATFIPGSTVLANLKGFTDAGALHEYEVASTSRKQRQRRLKPNLINRTYDDAHLQAIHRHLFGELYEWAGAVRTYPITKGMTTFAAPGEIADYLAAANAVVTQTDWDSLEHEEFAVSLARVFAYLNTAHPFREGNGRASKLFVQQLANQNGWDLDFLAVTPREWNNASAFSGPDLGSFEPVPDSLQPVFRRILVPLTVD